jgi:hypothetical protein
LLKLCWISENLKLRFKKNVKVIAITNCFAIILKQGMLNIRGALTLLISSRGAIDAIELSKYRLDDLLLMEYLIL